MSLALSTGLLFAPALASRLNQDAAPTAIEAGSTALGDLTAVADPVRNPSDEFAEPLLDPEAATTATEAADEALDDRPTTTTTAKRKAALATKKAKTASAAKAAPAPKPKPKPKATPAPSSLAKAAPKVAAKAAPKPAPASGPVKVASTPSQKSESETLACIRRVESGGNYSAVSPSGMYRGAYQMDNDFWVTYGNDDSLAGHHETASPAAQDAAAARGLRARGLAPWPQAVEECA